MGEKIQGLLKEIGSYNREEDRLKNSNFEVNQLFYALCYEKPKTKEEWFDLRNKVHAFLKSDNPESEKKRLMQYTEMLAMITSGFDHMDRLDGE
ncbi:MAG: hypothetical protein RR225_10225 [Clostridium sp.]